MFVKELVIRNFRNYNTLIQEFSSGVNLITGKNAQGKTNLLESLYLLSIGRSFRTAKDAELVGWNTKGYAVKATVVKKDEELELKLKSLRDEKKRCFVNGVEKKHLKDFIGKLNVVVFSPQDLSLVKGEPSNRRNFIDRELIQVNPVFNHYTSQYSKILTQRNNMLKQLNQSHKNLELLEVLNQQLTKYGAFILVKRLDIVRKLAILSRLVQRKITKGKEELEINYVSTLGKIKDKSFEEIKGVFMKKLASMQEKELERGITLIGPHRDDVTFLINGMDARIYGSQGQQRTTALSLKLAELEFIKSEVGEYPVLLLDDVFSELDSERQHYLLETIKNVQTFITVTDQTKTEIKPDKKFYVFNGVLKECQDFGSH